VCSRSRKSAGANIFSAQDDQSLSELRAEIQGAQTASLQLPAALPATSLHTQFAVTPIPCLGKLPRHTGWQPALR
jgi:hypothetical protein